jgi:hypothetical protein
LKYLFVLAFLTFATINANAQYYPPKAPQEGTTPCMRGSTPTQLLLKDSFKIKAANSVSSESARVADYLEFTTMEPIYSAGDFPEPMFDAGTSIYALVTRRNHRHFPLVRGKLEIALEPLRTWDNKQIEIAIARHGELTQKDTGPLNQEDLNERNKGINKPCKINRYNCVAGRGNAQASLVVTAVAGASGAAVSSLAKDDDTKFIAATSFFSIAKDLGNLLNGTDVGIEKDQIFNLYLKAGSFVCSMPKPKKDIPPTKVIIVK